MEQQIEARIRIDVSRVEIKMFITRIKMEHLAFTARMAKIYAGLFGGAILNTQSE